MLSSLVCKTGKMTLIDIGNLIKLVASSIPTESDPIGFGATIVVWHSDRIGSRLPEFETNEKKWKSEENCERLKSLVGFSELDMV